MKCNKDVKLHVLHFLYLKMLKALHFYLKKITTSPITIGVSSQTPAVGEPYKIMIKDINKDKINEVSNYFVKFGLVKNTTATSDEDKITVKFVYNDAKVYSEVIQKVHIISGQKIKLIPLAPLFGKIPYEKFEDPKLSIIHRIADEKTFDEQLRVLENKFEINKYTLQQKHKTISDNLESVLTSHFSVFKIHLFGFDFDESNLNVFVDLIRDTKLTTLQKIKNILQLTGDYSDFNETQTPVPSVICKHNKTEITLQINLRRSTVKIDTLIKYYLNLDPKLRSLIILIRFWSERYDLFGWEGFSLEILCFLVIFYLQQEPYKLPSLYDLQKGSTPCLIGGWNYSYTEFLDFTNQTLQDVTVKDLLIGFFKFYGHFDYISNIISPYLGRPVEKINFMKPYHLPEGYEEYIKRQKDLELNCGLCVQDPFDHSRNIFRLSNLDLVGRFTSLCRCAFTIMHSDQHQLLYRLFLYCEVSEFVEFPSFVIDKDDATNLSDWIQTIKKYTMTLLTEILKCKLSRIATFGVSQSVSYACVGQYNLWNERIETWKKFDKSKLKSCYKEVAVTSAVIGDRQPEIFWSVVIELNFLKTMNPSVKVSFLKKGGSFEVYHLCHFFLTRLKKFLKDDKVLSDNFANTVTVDTSNKSEEVIKTTEAVPDEGYVKPLSEAPPTHDSVKSLSEEKNENPEAKDQKLSPRKRKRNPEVDEFTEDEIPSDFFDDFDKEDFLKELDIVDAWDNDSNQIDKPSTRRKKKKRSKSRSRSKLKQDRRSSSYDRRSRSRSKPRSRHVRSRNRMSRSPKFRRSPRKRTRSRSRSYSPPRRHDRSKRRPFLEEIAEKLKAMEKSSSSPPVTTMPYNNQYFPTTSYFNPHPQPIYDESFFVGTNIWPSQAGTYSAVLPPPLEVSHLNIPPASASSVLPPLSVSPVSTSTLTPLPPAASPLSISSFSSSEGIIDNIPKNSDKKFSVGEKISQTLSAKAEVLSRCQHILKFLSRKGRLAIIPAHRRSSKELSNKYPSPLSSVEFSFTTPEETKDITDNFTFVLDKILKRFGLFDDEDYVEDLSDLVAKSIGSCDYLDKEDVVSILKVVILGEDAGLLGNPDCEEKVNAETQHNDIGDTWNIGIQVDRASMGFGRGDRKWPRRYSFSYS